MRSKELRFKELAIVTVTTSLLYGFSCVLLAVKGYGVWSPVWPGVISAGVSTTLLWSLTRWRPRFTFDRSAAKALGRYGMYLLGP